MPHLATHIPQLKIGYFTYCFDAQEQHDLVLCRACERDEGQLWDYGDRKALAASLLTSRGSRYCYFDLTHVASMQ